MKRSVLLVIVLVLLVVGGATAFLMSNSAAQQRELEALRNRAVDPNDLIVEPDAGEAGEADDTASSSDETEAPPELTAEEIFELAASRWEEIQDYHLTADVFTRRGDETQHRVLDYVFKRPSLYRSTEIEGDQEGSTATYNAEGVIHGRRGGLLSAIILTLEPDDERIRNLRGQRFFDSSWGNEIQEARDEMAAGWELVRLDDEVYEGSPCYVIATNAHPEMSEVTRREYWIDKQAHIFVRRREFEGDVLVRDSKYTNIEINVDPDDSLFSLK